MLAQELCKTPKGDRQPLAWTERLELLFVAGREGNGLDGPRAPSRSKGVVKEQELLGSERLTPPLLSSPPPPSFMSLSKLLNLSESQFS